MTDNRHNRVTILSDGSVSNTKVIVDGLLLHSIQKLEIDITCNQIMIERISRDENGHLIIADNRMKCEIVSLLAHAADIKSGAYKITIENHDVKDEKATNNADNSESNEDTNSEK